MWQLSGTQSWELCPTQGRQPKALGHTTAVVGDTLYIFGGIYRGNATNHLYMLSTGTNKSSPILMPKRKKVRNHPSQGLLQTLTHRQIVLHCQ